MIRTVFWYNSKSFIAWNSQWHSRSGWTGLPNHSIFNLQSNTPTTVPLGTPRSQLQRFNTSSHSMYYHVVNIFDIWITWFSSSEFRQYSRSRFYIIKILKRYHSVTGCFWKNFKNSEHSNIQPDRSRSPPRGPLFDPIVFNLSSPVEAGVYVTNIKFSYPRNEVSHHCQKHGTH